MVGCLPLMRAGRCSGRLPLGRRLKHPRLPFGACERVALARNVRLNLLDRQPGDVVRLEPEHHPLGHHGAHVFMVPLDVEQHQMG